MKDEKDIVPIIAHHEGMSDIDEQILFHRNIQKPSELMRFRHPDLFSDTRIDEVPRLPKAVFEYHLDTLTNRKQEYQFEHFCRKLAEKEICPNLRVQTGPTGGGDSKVDTETYPVAKEIVDRWWIGSPSAGKERWAFAFSAKKQWKSKLKADIENILSTSRDYKLIYFFTNQYVSDKERSKQEDALSKEAEIPVYIVDRAWIVEKVYDTDYQQLENYLAALGIDDLQKEKIIQPGPRDVKRLDELQELDKQVADPSRYRDARYQLVEDCLRSAILARSLERPRSEVEGRFIQADRLAREVNLSQQRLRIAYNRAWTAFWWDEDYTEFNRFYDSVEKHAKNSTLAHDVNLLLNLWMLLLPSVASGRIAIQDSKFEPRSRYLVTKLEIMSVESERPNNALQARTSLILMQILQAYNFRKIDEADDGWRELADVIDESDGMIAYSVEHLYGLIKELGEFLDSPAFDMLYDKLADAIKKRRSEGEAGIAYFDRARQKMKQEKPYEAIQWFGRAEELLTKDEYGEELVMTLIGISFAFEDVGLLWAARNKTLVAADLTLGVFAREGQLIPGAMSALKRLVWIELRLGRIPHILNAMNLTSSIASQLNLSEDQQQAYAEELQRQECVLGIHFLNIPVEALASVTRLPATLQRFGFDYALMALLFVLGHEQVLRKEGYIPKDEDADAVQNLFERWQDQPAAKDISLQPVLVDGKTSILKSTILGLELCIETLNNETSFGIAESLLGALEAFISTSSEEHVIPCREQMTVVITASTQLEGTPVVKFPENNRNRVEVIHPTNLVFTTAVDKHNYIDWLKDSLIQIICRMLIIKDIDVWLEQVAGQERGFSRALTFGDTLILNRNVFGDPPRMCLLDWIDKDAQSYDVLRKESWRTEKLTAADDLMKPLKYGNSPPPDDLTDKEKIKHTDRRVLSPIDIPVWDQANWRATVFVLAPNSLPILALAFEDGESGEAIFRAWKDRYGNIDKDNAIRLAIITGVSKRNPSEYSVVISPSLQYVAEEKKKIFMFVSRINRMSPNSSLNLDRFIPIYKKMRKFLLAPARINVHGEVLGMPSTQLAITKKHLDIREAWEIGENDPDMAVLRENDPPIIPSGVTNPPVNKAMAQIRSLRQAIKRRNN